MRRSIHQARRQMHSRDQSGEVELGPVPGHAAVLRLPVTCGITFTFGGVGITGKCEVKDTSGNVISGLFAAGEITGGSFFNNYPGGSGLMKGAVFGRLAGTHAADFAKANRA